MATKKRRKVGGNNNLLWVAILVISVAIFFSVLTFVQKFTETETYYVLSTDVPTRTQVTPDMLTPVVTNKGSAPQSIGIADVQKGDMFTQYPLKAGDILSSSNVGGLDDIASGVPDSWVVTNFSVNADNAVGGRITRGTYFDIMVATSDGSFYPFINVLALDTTVNLSGASSANAADTEEAHAGQTSQYVVGMPPGDAARLHTIVAQHGSDIRLLLSPRANEYQSPQVSEYSGVFTHNDSDEPIWVGKSKSGVELTDNTFRSGTNEDENPARNEDGTPRGRDSDGEPTDTSNCKPGNAYGACK